MFGGAAAVRGGARGARGADPFSGFGAPRGPRPGADVQARTTLSFRDAVEGATVTLQTAEGRRITTKIPAGVKDGQKIRLRGKGAEGDPGAPKGDLILTVAVDKHPVFGRDGDNLTVDLPVTFAEAALGATVVGADARRHPGARQGRARHAERSGAAGQGPRRHGPARHRGPARQGAASWCRSASPTPPATAVEALRAEEAEVDPRAALFEQAGS